AGDKRTASNSRPRRSTCVVAMKFLCVYRRSPSDREQSPLFICPGLNELLGCFDCVSAPLIQQGIPDATAASTGKESQLSFCALGQDQLPCHALAQMEIHHQFWVFAGQPLVLIHVFDLWYFTRGRTRPSAPT